MSLPSNSVPLLLEPLYQLRELSRAVHVTPLSVEV